MSSLTKNILVLAGLAAIAYAGYYLFVVNNGATLDSTSGSEGQALTTEFLQRLNEIEQIDLSTEVFSDVRFRSFVGFSSGPEPVSAGRNNPFSAR